jgi:peptide/nickel transport system substrate-binding protein
VSTLGPVFDGTGITAEGNQDLSYFNEPTVNQKIEALGAEVDRVKVAPKYGDLDEEIMKTYAPVVPMYYDNAYMIHGSKVAGTYNSTLYACPKLTNAYVVS